jgi:hypothetical protein
MSRGTGEFVCGFHNLFNVTEREAEIIKFKLSFQVCVCVCVKIEMSGELAAIETEVLKCYFE